MRLNIYLFFGHSRLIIRRIMRTLCLKAAIETHHLKTALFKIQFIKIFLINLSMTSHDIHTAMDLRLFYSFFFYLPLSLFVSPLNRYTVRAKVFS